MLIQNGMETPQGQMIGNRYVGASPWQFLGNLAQQYVGQKDLEDIDQKELKIAEILKAKEAANLQQGFNQLYGTKEFAQQGPTIEGGNIPVQPATAPNRQLALATLLSPDSGAAAKMIGSRIADLEFDQPKLHTVAPGGALVGPDGKLIYQAPFKPTGGVGDGMGGMDGEGRFNKKGDYIAPGGVFIGKTEVAKDREIARAANELRQDLQKLKPEDIKNTETILGDVTQSGFKKYLASQFGNPALAAQAKVNTSAVMQTLQNLPPGPASDKDIMQAKSSFPGYGNAKDLQDWVDNTQALLARKIANVNQKYGSENWYGAQGISTNAPSGGGDLQSAAAAELARRKKK
jgi:hypothetical protein